MRLSQFLLASATALSPITAAAYATPVIDQNFGSPFGTSKASESQQQFTVGVAGKLTSLEVNLFNGFNQASTVEVRLAESTGPYNGSTWLTDQEIQIGGSDAFRTIDLSAASIYVNPGDKFVIDISNMSSANDFFYTSNPNRPTYAGGDLYSRNTSTSPWSDESPLDMLFKTYVDPSLQPVVSSVPEPITLSVLGGGLIGLGLAKRSRKLA
jgi:hypothetical protein